MWKPLWKQKRIVVKPESCLGCRSCELICAYHRCQAEDLSNSAITVYGDSASVAIVPLMCMHCEEPECVKACAAGAITRNEETGVVAIEHSKCIMCKMCQNACPLGNIRSNRSNERMVKCDLCGGDPCCVKVCPVGAIDLVDSDDVEANTVNVAVSCAAASAKEVR